MSLLILLYPFAIIYGLITWIRNKLFDWGILKETKFDVPVISIGNLSMGGTGKTPHIEYLISKYKKTYSIAVISRGYGRETKGFQYVNTNDLAENVGDEPLQIKQKFEDIIVAVGENRVDAIRKVLKTHPEINLILLDDAFQHRYVKPSLNILLTEYSHPFWKDLVVPAGRLREFRCGWKRADAFIITKCPENRELKIPKYIQAKPIFYSKIIYQSPKIIHGSLSKKIVLVTGIANPALLLEYLKDEDYEIIHHFNFLDHHIFSLSDLNEINSRAGANHLILTTEKDWTRLKPFFENSDLNVGYLPIGIEIENEPEDWLKI